MSAPLPSDATGWRLLSAAETAKLLADAPVRWWLSGSSAFDQWAGSALRERVKSTVSVTYAAVGPLVQSLPAGMSAWVAMGDQLVAWEETGDHADIPSLRVYDPSTDAWVLQVNLEDGTDDRWVYRRDPRLQLPWERAVLMIDGVPTGAPEVQLVWKALRPKPEDEADKDVVLPALSEEARAWWEKAILSIHPHSTWSIHVRSPFAPAKASWNRTRRS